MYDKIHYKLKKKKLIYNEKVLIHLKATINPSHVNIKHFNEKHLFAKKFRRVALFYIFANLLNIWCGRRQWILVSASLVSLLKFVIQCWRMWRNPTSHILGLPRWLRDKESTCQARDAGAAGSNHGSGRSPGEGNGNLLQYFCLRNLMDRGSWRTTVHGVTKSRT